MKLKYVSRAVPVYVIRKGSRKAVFHGTIPGNARIALRKARSTLASLSALPASAGGGIWGRTGHRV